MGITIAKKRKKIGRRVLVVDDSPDFAEMLGRLLDSWGYLVKTVHDGKSALREALKVRPHAVLLDIGLPGIDGCTLAGTLRNSFNPDLIVAITGYEDKTDSETRNNFDHYLLKPFGFRKLREVLS